MIVCVVACHYDDEVLGCGGTIARHVSKGDNVTVCVVANRVYNHAYDPKDNLAEIDDLKAAQKALGYQNLICLKFMDEQLHNSFVGIVADLERVVADVKPDIVYIPHRGDYHQDHRTVHDAMMVVCRPHAGHGISMLAAYETTSSTGIIPACDDWSFNPNYYVDISDFVLLKRYALSCYRREKRKWPNPRSGGGVIINAQRRGIEVGFNAAEAFVVLRRIEK